MRPALILILALSAAAATVGAKETRPRGSVTLDVKDAEARVILKSIQNQCGIKNLVVDPDVQVKGSFYFRDLPCETALPVVLRTLGLTSVTDSESLVAVRTRR